MKWQPSLLKDMQDGEWQSDVEQVRSISTALNEALHAKNQLALGG
jgi:copper homeostasis protein